MVVHQALSGAGPVDAVTGQALAFRERFRGWGWGGADHAAAFDPRVGSAVVPLAQLRPAPDDVLLIHYSAYAPELRALLALPNPVLVLTHNVTPPEWLWEHAPVVAVQCALGRRQLPEFARRADLVAGVSAFNVAGLPGETADVPILFDPPPAAPPVRGDGRTLLFVGRLSPHKRHDELIRVLALLRRGPLPGARLVCVGEPVTERYAAQLSALAEELAPGAVTFERGLSAGALAARYAEAAVFVGLSEHEGFCIPLLEAFHHGVPVVARPAGGVPEVAGDAALLVPDRDLAVVAELVALAATDPELRASLAERGRARLAAFAPEATAAKLRAAVERAAATGRARRSSAPSAASTSPADPAAPG